MLKIESVTYSGYNQSATANYENGNLQDDAKVVIQYSLERVTFLSTDNRVWLTPPTFVYGSFDNARIIYNHSEVEAFAEFQQGDTIYISSGAFTGTLTIQEKIDNNTLRVNESIGQHEIYADGEYIACASLPKAIRYRYNRIPTDGVITFQNHLDGQEQIYYYDFLSSAHSVGSVYIMYTDGSPSHHNGTCRLDYVDKINNYKFVFTITQTYKMYPFILQGDVENLINNMPFPTWAGASDYGHIFSIELLKEQGNTDDSLLIESLEPNSDTGAYNEHFNTSTSEYYVESVEYKVNGNVATALDLYGMTEVKIVYKSNGKFTGSFTPNVSFMALHDNFANYLDTSQTYLHNFCFDKVNSYNADNDGTECRVFTNYWNQTIIDASTLEIKVRVSLGPKSRENIMKSATYRYALFITSEVNGQPVIDQGRSRDKIDAREFVISLPSLNIISALTNFWLDPSLAETGYDKPIPELFMTDDVYAVTQLSFPKSAELRLISIKNQVVALSNVTSAEVILDEMVTNVGSVPLGPDLSQSINISTQRQMNQSYKSTLTIQKTTDTPTDFVYNMQFPFIVGYREDKAITGQTPPAEVYEVGTVGNGLSSDWYKYADAGMSVKYRMVFVFEFAGSTYTQSILKPININDYDNPDWTAKYIKLYDQDGAELSNGGVNYIKGDVTIKAMFDRASLPLLADIQSYFFIAQTGSDGFRTSSVFDNSFKKIIFGNISIIAGEIICTGTLNAEDFKANVRIWSRLFERDNETLPNCIIISEDGVYMENEEATGYLIPELCGEPTVFYLIDSLGNKLKDSEGNRLIAF